MDIFESRHNTNMKHLCTTKRLCDNDEFWSLLGNNTVVCSFPRKTELYKKSLRKTTCFPDWILNENVSPPTYTIRNYADIPIFTQEFLMSAYINLLNYTLRNKKSLFKPDSDRKIPICIIDFALHGCQEWIAQHQKIVGCCELEVFEPKCLSVPQESINKTPECVKEVTRDAGMTNKHKEFLECYYVIMRGEKSYERISDKRQWKIVEEIKRTLNEVASELQRHAKNGVNMKLSTATGNLFNGKTDKDLLDTWILKTNSTAQYGVRYFKKLHNLLDEVNKNTYHCDFFTVQKAVKNRFLINGMQFKVYKYALILSVHPLKILPFKLCYFVMTKSTKDTCIYESAADQIILTPPDFELYLSSIKKEHFWKNHIRWQMLRAMEKTISSNMPFIEPREGSLEFVRATFILDVNLKPWLINMKSDPVMENLPFSDTIVAKVFRYIKLKTYPFSLYSVFNNNNDQSKRDLMLEK